MNTKRILSFLLCSVILLSVATGCATKKDTQVTTEPATTSHEPSSEPEPFQTSGPEETPEFSMDYAGQTVTIFSRRVNNEKWQDFVNLVKEKTGIIVEGVQAPTGYGDLSTKLASIVTTGDSTYDIFLVDELLGYTYSAAGYLEPIDDVMKRYENDYPENVMSRVVCCGTDTCYLMPLAISPMLFYVNPKIFAEENLSYPTNFEEFISTAQKLTKGERYGMGASWLSGGYLFNDLIKYIYLFDGDFYDWTNPNTQEALKFMYNMLYTYKITPPSVLGDNAEMMNQKFLDGVYAMSIIWSSFSISAKERFEVDVTVAPYPNFKTNTGLFNCWSMALNAASKKKEAAKEVLKVWAGFEGQQINVYLDGTARPDVLATKETQEKLPYAKYLSEYLKVGELKTRPMSVNVNEIQDIMESHASAYLSKQINLEECCQNVTKAVQELRD